MTPRGTLGLLGLFAVLAAYLLLVPPPTPAPLPESLLAVPVETVDAIELTWPDRSLHARRVDAGWHVDAGEAPPDAIGDLLGALSTLRPMEVLEAKEPIADYGLDTGATTLIVSASGTPVLHLAIGNRNPAWTGVYVRRIGSNDVLVVGALIHWELEKLHAMATR